MDMSVLAGATVRRVCPVIPERVAEMTEVPLATPVANPDALIVAVAVVAEAHVTWAVMSCVVFGPPALVYVPVAVNCFVPPAAMVGSAGVTAMDTSVLAGVTVSTAAFEVIPRSEAVMFAVPAATPMAVPPEAIVAIAEFEDVQVTAIVSSCVVPSLKRPVAVNCCVLPATTEALVGATVK